MAYNTKQIVKDKDGNPISQYYNPVTDQYEPVEGNSGGNKVVVQNNDLSLIPILEKLSQLTGTVIDEETRKANEIARQSNETLRINAETSRKNAENIRVTSEKDRVTKETDRVAKETIRVDAEKVRVSNETARQSNETERNSNENIRKSNETVRISNENLRVDLYDDLLSKVASGYFKGEKGDTGNGLEFYWRGTELGIRVKGDTQYVYVDLKGEKGDTGSIENLTKKHVTDALGYTPPTQDTITSINNKTGIITKEDIVALGVPAQDTNTTYYEITDAEIDAGNGTTPRTITGRRVKYILDKVQTWIRALTKSDVGLSNVDNVKQMPITGGTFTGEVNMNDRIFRLPFIDSYNEVYYLHNIASSQINLNGNKTNNIIIKIDRNISINGIVDSWNRARPITYYIVQGATAYPITFLNIIWRNNEIPDLTTPNKLYILTFAPPFETDKNKMYGMFGGMFDVG